ACSTYCECCRVGRPTASTVVLDEPHLIRYTVFWECQPSPSTGAKRRRLYLGLLLEADQRTSTSDIIFSESDEFASGAMVHDFGLFPAEFTGQHGNTGEKGRQ